MKRSFVLAIVALLCLCLLAGCGASPAEEANSGDTAEPEIQELTAKELQELFEKTYADKGNGLDTAEQLALELAELKKLSANAALPVDYEAQYKKWRSKQVKAMLESLYEQYDSIISELKIGSGPIPGACYAERIDFENDGIPELFILSTEKLPNYDSVRQGSDAGLCFVVEAYGTKGGQVEKLGEEHIDYTTYLSLGICKSDETTSIHSVFAGRSDDRWDDYYSVKNGFFSAIDRVGRSTVDYIEPEGGGELEAVYDCTSFDKPISIDEYEVIQSKYSETDSIAGLYYTTPTVSSRGILPEIPQDVQRRAEMWNVLNNSGIQYAHLADMDGNGVEDLVIVESKQVGEYAWDFVRAFCIYHWNGSELEKITFDDMEFGVYGEGGIYRSKSTGELFLYCNNSADGSYDITYQFRNFSKSENISTADFEMVFPEDVEGWDFTEKGAQDFRAAIGKYEVVDEFELGDDNRAVIGVSTVRGQLVEG